MDRDSVERLSEPAVRDAKGDEVSEIRANKTARDAAAKVTKEGTLSETTEFLDSMKDVVDDAGATGKKKIEEILVKAGVAREDATHAALKPLDDDKKVVQDADRIDQLSKKYAAKAGDPDSFEVAAEADLFMEQKGFGLGAGGAAWVEATILGSKGSIFYSGFVARISKSDGAKFAKSQQAKVFILGTELYKTELQDQKQKKEDAPTLERATKKSVTYYYSLGPVPMESKVGFSGSVHVKPELGFEGMGARVGVMPGMQIEAFVTAAATAGVVKAGVESELTLINLDYLFAGSASRIVDEATNDTALRFAVNGETTLKAMVGKLATFVEVDIELVQKKFSKTFFKYSGIELNQKKLFAFEKIVGKDGIKFGGAPQPIDKAEGDCEDKLNDSFHLGYEMIKDEEDIQSYQRMNTLKSAYDHTVTDTLAWMAEVRKDLKNANE